LVPWRLLPTHMARSIGPGIRCNFGVSPAGEFGKASECLFRREKIAGSAFGVASGCVGISVLHAIDGAWEQKAGFHDHVELTHQRMTPGRHSEFILEQSWPPFFPLHVRRSRRVSFGPFMPACKPEISVCHRLPFRCLPRSRRPSPPFVLAIARAAGVDLALAPREREGVVGR